MDACSQSIHDLHDEQWTSKFMNGITSTSNAITLHIPCAQEQQLLTIHIEFDEQKKIHTHAAMQNIASDGHSTFVHGFYRHPDGEVIGPIFRD